MKENPVPRMAQLCSYCFFTSSHISPTFFCVFKNGKVSLWWLKGFHSFFWHRLNHLAMLSARGALIDRPWSLSIDIWWSAGCLGKGWAEGTIRWCIARQYIVVFSPHSSSLCLLVFTFKDTSFASSLIWGFVKLQVRLYLCCQKSQQCCVAVVR